MNGRCTFCDLSIAGSDIRIISAYAPHNTHNARARERFFTKLAPKINKRTVLAGDFNCVLDVDLDLRRDATCPYENKGHEELRSIVATNELTDEIRRSLGSEFEFTKHTITPSGTCRSRIDRQYLPSLPDAHWTSRIIPLSISDHEAGTIAELELRNSDNVRGKDLASVKADLVYEPSVNSELASLITKANESLPNARNKGKLLKRLKADSLRVLKKATRRFRKKANQEIAEMELHLSTLHAIHVNKPKTTAADVAKRDKLINDLKEKRSILNPTKPHSALFRFKAEEQMSRQFWQRSFHSSKSASFINAMNVVDDWSNPPPKTDGPAARTTAKVANEAAKFYSFLGRPPPVTRDSDEAADILIKKLKEWGVNEDSANLVGAPIELHEVIDVAGHVPKGRSSGPDRVPNEWYRAFAKRLAPILVASYNETHEKGRLPKGFADGIVSIMYKKGSRHDIRNYRPITLLNGDYKILTRILARRLINVSPVHE